jgi:uncharacterized protein YqgV (UPF0045/DUF77 family)
MNASIELSLYPLKENYKEKIVAFILRLKKYDKVTIQPNGMSTQIFGDYDVIMDIVKNELREELSNHRCMAVMKIGDGFLTSDKLPEQLL